MKLFYRLTLVALILAVAMTSLSAYIRLADSGVDCQPWPDCFAYSFRVDVQPGITIDREDPNLGLRTLHRLMASGFGLLALLMVTLAWWYRSLIVSRRTPTLIMLLTLVLALVGMRTPDLQHPLVTLINLSGGMLLGILLLWLLLQQSLRVSPGLTGVISMCVLVLTTMSGAWVSANFAAGACQSMSDCGFTQSLADAFNPGRVLLMENGRLRFTDAQSLILVGHYFMASTAVILIGWIGYQGSQGSYRNMIVLAIVVATALVASGIYQHFNPGVSMASVHNFLALLLLLILTRHVHVSARAKINLPEKDDD
jgi:cytochrome c oxidase assembly protein subunit 15